MERIVVVVVVCRTVEQVGCCVVRGAAVRAAVEDGFIIPVKKGVSY